MCVNQYTMVPAVVNLVATKGRDTYSGFISEFTCFKCKHFSNALDLSAPASDVLLKSRSSNWFQLSGHPDSLAPAGPGTVWKKRSVGADDTERIVYEEMSQDPTFA
ncbi:hypothetical protein NQ317_003686 [Molorchus minor]|uniref:Uncharacterized protein n=1 Tax=Molorchus minor TaxID=1323400 RepID=A0ABQ9K4H9_9CUCU|nr:hypothetical protein NQ317_003686 [Molorchus minor]